MTAERLLEPLAFRNLTVRNRVLRSSIAGRFDNYDGGGSDARISFETRLPEQGSARSFPPSSRSTSVDGSFPATRGSNATSASPSARARRASTRARLPLHRSARTRRPPTGHRRHRVREGLSSTDKADPLHGFPCEAMTQQQIDEVVSACTCCAPRPRGGVGRRGDPRRERLPLHAVPELGGQRPQGRLRRVAREPGTAATGRRARDPCGGGADFHLQVKDIGYRVRQRLLPVGCERQHDRRLGPGLPLARRGGRGRDPRVCR